MSGVLTKKLGRRKSTDSWPARARYSSSSPLSLRQVKYVYDWWKPTLPSMCIIGGPGERLGEEEHVGVGGVDLGEQPLPERHRLGVRVVDPEDPDAVGHPVPHDPQDLGVDPLRVVVEVDRVDVLVLLRRVLGVGDRAVGPGGEPLRVLAHPRVVGRALQGEVERDLHAELACAGDEGVEVLQGAEVRVDRVVAALGGADRPGDAGIAGAGDEGVVGALAEGAADRVDRRQVDDVEAHLGDRRQPLGGGA